MDERIKPDLQEAAESIGVEPRFAEYTAGMLPFWEPPAMACKDPICRGCNGKGYHKFRNGGRLKCNACHGRGNL